MNVAKIVLGAVMIGISYEVDNMYSPLLLVQGIVMINLAIKSMGEIKSLSQR